MGNDLDRWLREAIAPTLRSRGFRGGPRRYQRRSDGLVCGLRFQGSPGNVFGRFKFTLDYGVWHAWIGHLTGNDDPHGWQINRRVGITKDLWGEVGVGANRERAGRAVLGRLSTEVLPFLDEVGTPAGFEAFWQGQPEPFRSDFLPLLEQAEDYDPAQDPRTATEKQFDRLARDPRARAWLASDPAAAVWVAWCTTCGRPAIRAGAPVSAMPIAMLQAMGASGLASGTICDACASRSSTAGSVRSP